jgi:hypothetical protein
LFFSGEIPSNKSRLLLNLPPLFRRGRFNPPKGQYQKEKRSRITIMEFKNKETRKHAHGS